MNDGILPSGTPPAPPPVRPDNTAIITKAPFSQAPAQAALPNDGDSQRLEGRVVAERPPVDNQVRIQTDKGDIVIRTEKPVAPDTQVIVDLQRQKAALIATVRIANRIADAQVQLATASTTTPNTPTPTPTTPAPAVVPGDRLTALVLSGTIATTPPTAANLQAVIQQAVQSGSAAKIPLPASLLTAFAASTDPDGFIAALPPEQRLILQQQTTAAMPPPATVMDDAAALDNGLLTLFRAMTTANLTQQVVQNMPAPAHASGAPPLPAVPQGLIQALLPMLQNLQSPLPASMPGGLPFPQMPAGAELRIVSIQTPGTPPLPAPAPPLLQGSVIGQTSTGMAVIHTPKADFVLNTRVALPIGSQITFTATPLSADALTARLSTAGLGGSLSFDPLAGKTWPALSEALQILTQHNPATTAKISHSIPSPGPRMVPATLFFMAALKMGMVENWLGGQAMQNLRDHGPRGAADRLTADFSTLSRQANEPLPGDWRGISLPMLHDAQLSQIQLFVRRQHDDEANGGQDSGQTTRFIVNLTLSRLGDMQLDGLMRQKRNAAGQSSKNLDMVIRTADRLPAQLMKDLQSAYAQGLADTGLQGGIQFQVKRDGWVNITRAAGDAQVV